ncbi:acyltransferase [Weissella cibaria]|uniref:acyltransferase n=1 Tax=Weissella cibaria TaxID=137591 RepID=UPI00189C36A3|nr:acyltransferase [Weissella cibaria]
MKFDIKKILWIFRAALNGPFFRKIGPLSYMGKPVSIVGRQNISLGRNVHIYPGARIESYNHGSIVIQDNVSISENVHIVAGGGTLVIGSGTLIGPNVFISNSDHQYRNVDKRMMEQELVYKDIQIGQDNYIGVGAAILPGTKTGTHVVIGANSTVMGVVDNYTVIAGSPASIIRKYSAVTKEWERINGTN